MNEKYSTFQPPIKTLVIVFIFSLLAGCASSHFKHASDEEARDEINSITSIAVLEVPEPLQYKFGEGLGGPVSGFFYVFGAMYSQNAFDSADHTLAFEDHFKFSEQMQKKLVTDLQHNNIQVMTVAVPRNKDRQLVDSYEGFPADVDAYLDVVPIQAIGYMSDEHALNFDPDVHPVLAAAVRLVSARSKKVLFEDQFYYGDSIIFRDDIEAPEEHVYDTKEELLANRKEAYDRLIAGVNTLGSKILQDISPFWNIPQSK